MATVYQFRAVRSAGVGIDADPDPMVQQQYARLKFFDRTIGFRDCRVLDWGCGTGYNVAWLLTEGGAAEAEGFDLSVGAVELARRAAPGATFRVADACDPGLAIEPGSWDRILSCEVLEHVPDMPGFLANIRRHLAPGGVALISTPNRPVFSLGHEPSPVNREHIREPNLDEFRGLLAPHFSQVEIRGQVFREGRLMAEWEADVRRKIAAMEAGTRWDERPTLRGQLIRLPGVRSLYNIAPLQAAWRFVRWGVFETMRVRRACRSMPYRHSDFAFTDDAEGGIWLCAACRA